MTNTFRENDMKAKLFIYLDEYKMYSISSQLFEGLTEEIIQYQAKGKKEKEEQQGPIGSGRLLGDILSETDGRAERRFLFDYAYTIFERRILEEGHVCCISEESSKEELVDIESKSFIKVTGNVSFNDFTEVRKTLNELNQMSDALHYVATHEARNLHITALRHQLETAPHDRKKQIHQEIKSLSSTVRKEAIDEEYIKKLAYVLDYGYGDHLEAQFALGPSANAKHSFVTAVLSRESMREAMAMEIKKYSRRPQQRFTVLGVVTQCGKRNLLDSPIQETTKPSDSLESLSAGQDAMASSESMDSSHLKIHIGSMVENIANIEKSFTGCLDNEIIIDPIAIYREI
jgi:hypothetical protein